METLTVRDIYDGIDGMAPFGAAEPWDNVGLLVGGFSRPVRRILLALDATEAVAREALERGCELIVSHHPVLFRPAKALREDDAEGRLLATLLRDRVSLIAAHTNWDIAPGGVSDALADALGLTNVRPLTLGRIGMLPGARTLAELLDHARDRLRTPFDAPPMRLYGPPDAMVRQVAVCGGSGMDTARDAREAGADALVTGDIRHHEALDALADGLLLIDAGHVPSERPSLYALQSGLQSLPIVIKYKTQIFVSDASPYA